MMNQLIVKKFGAMGARVKFRPFRPTWHQPNRATGVDVGIRRNREGQYFQIAAGSSVEIEVVDLKPKQQHLLLLARIPAGAKQIKSKFLCGYDERNWFVAAVPERRSASNVATAMEALKPREVLRAQARKRVRHRHKRRRKTAAYVRQGEWFFIPAPYWRVEEDRIVYNEPLQRNGGKPHIAEMLIPNGGTKMYVNLQFPHGLTEQEHQALQAEAKAAGYKLRRFRTRRRDAGVMVKGKISHPDHRTVELGCWHVAVLNTETESRAMQYMAFQD
jgi:hypothetical protein